MSRLKILQPLPEAAKVAADLRRKAKDLILMAQRLEATLPQDEDDNEAPVFRFDPRTYKVGAGNMNKKK